jgi:hypothetical protein
MPYESIKTTATNFGKLLLALKGIKLMNTALHSLHAIVCFHFIFDVKHDLLRKSHFVAGGHMTTPPKDSSLRSLRLCIFLWERNGLDVDAADVGNAYLMAYTKDKLYIITVPKSGDRQECLLIIVKALYGIQTSGARWHEFFADTLMDMGFYPCKVNPNV